MAEARPLTVTGEGETDSNRKEENKKHGRGGAAHACSTSNGVLMPFVCMTVHWPHVASVERWHTILPPRHSLTHADAALSWHPRVGRPRVQQHAEGLWWEAQADAGDAACGGLG